MILFASTQFFIVAIALPILLLLYKILSRKYSPYLLFVSFLTLVISLAVYIKSPIQPIVLFCVSFFVLRLVQKSVIRKSVGIVITLLPLVLLKTGAVTFFEMIGISFATFRAIDVLLFSDASQSADVVEYFTYLFFPMTLLAGPMYRWRRFKSDLAEARQRLSFRRLLDGWEVLALGIIQKFAVAQIIYSEVLQNTGAHDYSAHGMVINALGYSAYLYFDFAGYSNMALGIAGMFGFDLPENFRNPIASRNPQDFWRRWHISLSEWLRDVVFIPIYKSLQKFRFFLRHKVLTQNIGVFATLFFMGTWNGLQREYVLSGVLFGSYSVGYNTMINAAKTRPHLASAIGLPPVKLFGRLLNLALAVFALYVFSGRSPL